MSPQDLIEKYISGDISPEEMKNITSLCETDASFKEDFEFHKNLQRVTAHEDDIAFKNTIQSFESAQETSKRNPRIWWIAASFIGVLLITYFFNFQQTTPETLFAENFEPYRNVIQPIVRGENDETLITKAFVAYENKEYEKAIQGFSELIETENTSYASFYLANSYLAIDNTEKAIPLLTNYIADNGKFKEKASWYLALANLKAVNQDEAKIILQNIVTSKTYNFEKAELLLKEL